MFKRFPWLAWPSFWALIIAAGAFAAVSLSSCTQLRPDVAYVAAAQSTVKALEPIVLERMDGDPDNNVELTGADKAAIEAVLRTWHQLQAEVK